MSSYMGSRTQEAQGGVSGRYARFISSSKVGAFETLYKSLLKHYRTAGNLERELKIGRGIMTGMFKDKKLSEHYAKKILDKFNELKRLKSQSTK